MDFPVVDRKTIRVTSSCVLTWGPESYGRRRYSPVYVDGGRAWKLWAVGAGGGICLAWYPAVADAQKVLREAAAANLVEAWENARVLQALGDMEAGQSSGAFVPSIQPHGLEVLAIYARWATSSQHLFVWPLPALLPQR